MVSSRLINHIFTTMLFVVSLVPHESFGGQADSQNISISDEKHLSHLTDITNCGPDVFFQLLKLRNQVSSDMNESIFVEQLNFKFPETQNLRAKYGASFKEMKWLIQKHIGKADVLSSKMENVHFIIDRIDILVSIVTDVSNHFVILTNSPNDRYTYIIDPTIGTFYVHNDRLEQMLLRGSKNGQLIFIPILGKQAGVIKNNDEQFRYSFDVSIARGRSRAKYGLEIGTVNGLTQSDTNWFHPNLYFADSSYFVRDKKGQVYRRFDSVKNADGISFNDVGEISTYGSSLDRIKRRDKMNQKFIRINFDYPGNSYFVNGSIEGIWQNRTFTNYLLSESVSSDVLEKISISGDYSERNVRALLGVTRPWIFYRGMLKYDASLSAAISKSLTSNPVCQSCSHEALTIQGNIKASANDSEYNNLSYGLGTTVNFTSRDAAIHITPSLERYYPDKRLLVRLSGMLSKNNDQSGLSITNTSLSVYRPLSNDETLGASLNIDWDRSGSIHSKSVRVFRQHANGWNVSLEYILGQEYLANIKSNSTIHDINYGFVNGQFADKRHLSLSLSYKWEL
jgi:hypothetical protein